MYVNVHFNFFFDFFFHALVYSRTFVSFSHIDQVNSSYHRLVRNVCQATVYTTWYGITVAGCTEEHVGQESYVSHCTYTHIHV